MILIPEPFCDHRDALQDSQIKGKHKESIKTYSIAFFTCLGCDRIITKISCTPANAKLSKVQSSSGALQIGIVHWKAASSRRKISLVTSTHSGFVCCEGSKSFIEAICENDSLKNVVVIVNELLLAR
jgi:hypothetical protein